MKYVIIGKIIKIYELKIIEEQKEHENEKIDHQMKWSYKKRKSTVKIINLIYLDEDE